MDPCSLRNRHSAYFKVISCLRTPIKSFIFSGSRISAERIQLSALSMQAPPWLKSAVALVHMLTVLSPGLLEFVKGKGFSGTVCSMKM